MLVKFLWLLPKRLHQPPPYFVDLPAKPKLDEMRAAVMPFLDLRGMGALTRAPRSEDFGYATQREDIEHVSIRVDGADGEGERRDMFVGEYSAIRGLPVNDQATELYWAAARATGVDPADDPKSSRIHGPAVFFPEKIVWY